MTYFVEMLEGATEVDESLEGPELESALVVLWQRLEARGKLDIEGVWRLCRGESKQLSEDYGGRPPGGWRALCALAVGTGLLRAGETSFESGRDRSVLQLEGRALRGRLVEGMTRWLIPPGAAAGLFLTMGVHPLWGLRLARRLHTDAPVLEGPLEGWRDEELLPVESLEELRKGVFATLSVIVSGLRRLKSDRSYDQEALVGFVMEAIDFGRAQIEEPGDGLGVLLHEQDEARQRSSEFATDELLDGVLVPAGVVWRGNDGSFRCRGTSLRGITVGALDEDGQRRWFQRFLMETPGELVA